MKVWVVINACAGMEVEFLEREDVLIFDSEEKAEAYLDPIRQEAKEEEADERWNYFLTQRDNAISRIIENMREVLRGETADEVLHLYGKFSNFACYSLYGKDYSQPAWLKNWDKNTFSQNGQILRDHLQRYLYTIEAIHERAKTCTKSEFLANADYYGYSLNEEPDHGLKVLQIYIR